MGCTALMLAAFRGNKDVVQLLIDHGAVIEARNGIGETALIGAIHNEEEEVVKMLIEAGADANTRTDNGNTALIKAARRGLGKLVEVLLDHGADINAQNTQMDHPSRTTAIHQAAWCGKLEIAELLSERGADTDGVGKARLRGLYEKSKMHFVTGQYYEVKLLTRLWKTTIGTGVETIEKIPFSELPFKSRVHHMFSQNGHPALR